MTLIRGGPAGPDGGTGAWANEVETDRATIWDALGARQGIIRGLVPSGVAGQMALSFTPGSALVAERDASGNPMDSRGYYSWSDTTFTVSFAPASASARNDAVVVAFVDTEDGPIGTGVTEVGPQVVVVQGVSGTTTPRSDAQINTAIGRGGWYRMFDVPIASGATEINTATMVDRRGAGFGRTQFVRKPTDESVASSTTLQDDDHLAFDAVAGQTYDFEVLIFGSSNSLSSVGDIKVGFSFPGGILDFLGVGANNAAISAGSDGTGEWLARPAAGSGTSSIPYAISNNSILGIIVKGTFVCTTSGTVRLQWSQNTSNTVPTIVKAGSRIRAVRVA